MIVSSHSTAVTPNSFGGEVAFAGPNTRRVFGFTVGRQRRMS
ncbi:hypothetical protein RB6178 [Rhodopirellula baltica SH 1]|uniref:Uncharacterized protein n=1 Tax=Rhodopirellula baltica (strain DSM 10527 / NCIMB 13988 / SH1) TaxID=243090 RepID=Q7UQP8_RHOBA|nr:hypothetical protein RB6178 [Rhodopirellula baltica SH 1]